MFNSAISEAYYSMFYSAKALLSLKNFHPKKHRGVLRLLGRELVSKGYIEEVYGKIFAKDMELRKKADYDISFKASREEAESVIDDAERFLERIRKAIEALKGKGELRKNFSLCWVVSLLFDWGCVFILFCFCSRGLVFLFLCEFYYQPVASGDFEGGSAFAVDDLCCVFFQFFEDGGVASHELHSEW